MGRRGGELIKVKSGDFSGKSFRYCNVTTQPGDRRIVMRNRISFIINLLDGLILLFIYSEFFLLFNYA